MTRVRRKGLILQALFSFCIMFYNRKGSIMEYVWTNRTDYDYQSILEAQKKQQEELMQKVMTARSNGGVKKVIFNEPATIVYWNDGDKTVVKCMAGETFNRWTGFAMAVCKKIMCENDPIKFHRWMKDNCGEEAALPSYSDSETSAEVFSNSLSDVLNGLWNTISKVEDDD